MSKPELYEIKTITDRGELRKAAFGPMTPFAVDVEGFGNKIRVKCFTDTISRHCMEVYLNGHHIVTLLDGRWIYSTIS
jgi:hypothetical protein